MKFTFRLFAALFLTLSFLYSSQKTFKVSFDPDYAPFSYIENGKPEGLLIDYWELWAQKNNYKIKFINGKFWENAINMVKRGDADFFLGTSPYQKWMKSSIDIYKTRTSLFINKEFTKDFNLEASYLIGVVGEDHKRFIKKNFPNSEIIEYSNYRTLFNDLLSQKIDIAFDDKTAIEFYSLRNGFFHKIKPLDLLESVTPIKAIAKSSSFIDTFNKGFKKISEEELYDVENKWIINSDRQIYKKSFELTQEEKDFIKSHIINVSVSKSWAPFSFISKDNDDKSPQGISSEIWDIIVKELKLKCNYIIDDNFTQQLEKVKNRKVDLIFSAGDTNDREKYATFSDAYAQFPISIVTLKDENFIENFENILDKKIAVGKNFTAHRLLLEKYPHIKNLILVKNPQEGLEKVANKEAYAYVDIKPLLLYNINKLRLKDLKISGNTPLTYKIRVLLRKDYTLLQSAINKAIGSLSKDDVSKIVAKWNNVQFKDNFNYRLFAIVLVAIFLIFVLLIYFNQANIRRNRVLKELVDERTKELKELNQELEKRVQNKTRELVRTNYLLDEAQKIARLGSFSYKVKTKELRWSNEHYKIFGLKPKEITPTVATFLSYVHEDDKERVKRTLLISAKTEKRRVVEFKIVLKDGSIKYLQLNTKVTKFESHRKASFIVGTILDLTKIKNLELQKREKDTMLAQQSKMAALGEMLENIAHQWRQPLSVISTASTGLQLQIDLGNEIKKEDLYQSVKSINEHSQYLSKTIDDFRNFFNPRKEKFHFNIDSTIEKTLSLVSSRVKKESIHVIKDIKDVEIKTIESELIQILLNILNNAVDAIKSSNIENRYIFINAFEQNRLLHIKIYDNAGGIPKKIINRVFEPYFTTKHKSQGTGIGLYMSNEIISKHLNGQIRVSNTTYKYEDSSFSGALFSISIPIGE